jgi:hypothetical protein
VLIPLAARARQLRTAFGEGHKEQLADFSLVKNMFSKAAEIFRVNAPAF